MQVASNSGLQARRHVSHSRARSLREKIGPTRSPVAGNAQDPQAVEQTALGAVRRFEQVQLHVANAAGEVQIGLGQLAADVMHQRRNPGPQGKAAAPLAAEDGMHGIHERRRAAVFQFILDQGRRHGVQQIAPPDVRPPAQCGQRAGRCFNRDQVGGARHLLPPSQLADQLDQQCGVRKRLAALSLPPGVVVESRAGHARIVSR